MKLTKAIITVMLVLQGVACAAPFLDDFETDTSANYTDTVTFGSGTPSFNVTGGMLNVLNDGNITYDVFHNTARLAIGETVSVDLLSGAQDVYLTISTTNRGPNTGSEDGIRLNWIGSMRARIYNDGSGENIVHADEATPSSLYITRDTDTSYTYGYDSTELNTGVTIAGTAGIDMQVGIETYGSGTRVWDNLQIADTTTRPAINSFTVSSTEISEAGDITFKWHATNVDTATLNGTDVTGLSPLHHDSDRVRRIHASHHQQRWLHDKPIHLYHDWRNILHRRPG